MPKVLFEVSYIGSPKGFLLIVWICAVSIFVWIGSIRDIKKAKKENSMCVGYVGVVLVGMVGSVTIVGRVVTYGRDILGYKWWGEYREVEGIVEDYTKTKNGYTFTIDGVEFEVSVAIPTWGYFYSHKTNVITENGQQLRIRYTNPTTILYIEEIGPPLAGPNDTEEAQQERMVQEEVGKGDMAEGEAIEEVVVPIDQDGIRRRTEEETDMIRKILSQDKEEFQSFFTADRGYPYKETIRISAYDFTGDGRDELLVSKYYVDMSAELTYNYVYDQTGRRVLEFVGGGDTRIIDGWDGNGTFLLYDKNYYFYAPRYNTNTYTEIRCEDGVLTAEVILVELDRRPPGDYGKEEYYIFTDFTKEEEGKLWEGGLGVNELTETKAYVRADKRAEEYKRLFQERETTGFSRITMICYSESDGFQEYVEAD